MIVSAKVRSIGSNSGFTSNADYDVHALTGSGSEVRAVVIDDNDEWRSVTVGASFEVVEAFSASHEKVI